jgi:hypothetical protein
MINNRLIKLPIQFVNAEQVDMGIDEDNVETHESYIYTFVNNVRAFGPAGPPNQKDKTILYFIGDPDGWIIQMPVNEVAELVTNNPTKLS